MDDYLCNDVYITTSSKLETGKTRLLLASDTRILLDPGKSVSCYVVDRVKQLSGRVNIMLDYDDFNSQHSLFAQHVVIDEVCKYVRYNEHNGKRLVDSFNHIYVYCKEKCLGKARYGLMSGHRGITFLNSILNVAYIRLTSDDFYKDLDIEFD
ncbi:RNA-directed RNA polymerase, luteovirus family-containing protein [Strongyloides ratti]|uniref:RNA-directed RNA polymerase, luteovirus family-containing protein n=1 Tax=Strongyloides ratti TaxID=34506 RepID=A0A090KT45_STRRB|nr:RNA-directed RNA polymerase, luteovirus family-containing protein [Strongyloides ratti]CEF60581.1 RNA-directed RNA polymerase, luteovirus family-containing protein [Strongyloides ratti]